MSFRDDREAAHQRADALEQELKRTQAELEQLRSPKPPGGGRSAGVALAVVALVLTAGVGGVVVMVQAWDAQDRAAAVDRERTALQDRERTQQAAREAEFAARLAAGEAEIAERERASQGLLPPQSTSPTAHIVWRGSVDQAVGVTLAAGTPCTLDGSFERAGSDFTARELTIECGGQVLYRAGAGGAAAEVGLREGPISGSTAHVYTLRYRDEGAGRPAQVTVSTLQHTAVVSRGGEAAMRVTMFVRDVSDPREGEALGGRAATRVPSFAGVTERAARVTAARGRAPVASGARCVFVVRPVWEFPENCRMALRCGETWIYGARESGYLTCEVQGGRPVAALDENASNNGGDPRVTWRGRRVVVSDFTEAGDWSLDLAL